MLFVKNDSNRLKKELVELKNKNKELWCLIIDLYKWIDINFKKDVIITQIFRTNEEQKNIYGEDTKKKSTHQFMQAIDIRSSIYSKEETDKIVNYLNNKYNSSNYYKWTSKVHEVNNFGMHFHIQYYKI